MSLGVTVILPSTYFFVAPVLPPGPELPAVSRVNVPPGVSPVNVKTALASASKTPGVLLLMVIVQVAVRPSTEIVGVAQVSEMLPGAGETEGVIAMLLGVRPVASTRAVAVTVKVCGLPTSLMSLGVTVILPSTYFFVAPVLPPGPELPAVSQVNGPPRVSPVFLNAALPFASKTPGVLL